MNIKWLRDKSTILEPAFGNKYGIYTLTYIWLIKCINKSDL